MKWLRLAAVAMLLSAGPVAATVEEDALSESAMALMSWIKARVAYDPGTIAALQSPKVKIRPREFFDQIACRGSHRVCHRIAWYNGGDTIYLRDDINASSLDGSGYLLHEVAHYVQERNDNFREVNECNRYRREKEAYALQKDYLIENGQYPTFAIYLSPPVGCGIAVK